MSSVRQSIRSYIDTYGLSHSFICTTIGGCFLIASGIYVDPNLGRALTGVMIALRGFVSELSRKALTKNNFSEPAAGLPGMFFAACMNWPAFLFSSTIFEATAFGLAALAMTLKFIQYLPVGLCEIPTRMQLSSQIPIRLARLINSANQLALNKINKHAVFGVLFGIALYSTDVYQRQDYAGVLACAFLLYGGLTLAVKTRIELSAYKV